jgi:hypothetical protein
MDWVRTGMTDRLTDTALIGPLVYKTQSSESQPHACSCATYHNPDDGGIDNL